VVNDGNSLAGGGGTLENRAALPHLLHRVPQTTEVSSASAEQTTTADLRSHG
jgi:hypothetical protein